MERIDAASERPTIFAPTFFAYARRPSPEAAVDAAIVSEVVGAVASSAELKPDSVLFLGR